MCLIALYYRAVPDAPIVIGANREEYFARGGEAPQLMGDSPRFVAGLDPTAGGSWLGVNEHGLVVAVTNRQKGTYPADARSRGLLTRDLLGLTSTGEALKLATKELDTGRYAGCNFMLVDAERAIVIHGGNWLRVRYLPPGLHVLTASDLDDESDGRIAFTLNYLQERRWERATEVLTHLKELCGRTENPPICLRGPDRGTVSSTLLALREPLGRSKLWHAQGPPDQTEYADLSDLMRQMFSRSED